MAESKEEQIQKLQLLEQNLQNYLAQRQQFQSQMIEIDSAIAELENQTSAYKIVGNIMVSVKKEELESDLTKKKEIIELRIKNIEKQENLIRQKAKAIQEEVMKAMDNKSDDN